MARKGLVILLGLSVLAGLFWWGGHRGIDESSVAAWVEVSGRLGPGLIVALMAVAIVVSPLPSAPIALAAGAAYGHVAGTIYVVLGAELGALIAFGVARILGREVIKHWFGERVETGLLGSQNALMFAVLVSRLLPFVSFDLVSYAAGLSGLNVWRFAVATLAGIVPASFLLAHIGAEAVKGDWARAGWAAIGLVAATLFPVLVVVLRDARKGRGDAES